MKSSIHPVELPELSAEPSVVSALTISKEKLLSKIPLVITVVAGELRMPIEQLLQTKVGELLSLDRKVDQALDLVIDGTIIAKGKLIVIDENLGVEVTQVTKLTV